MNLGVCDQALFALLMMRTTTKMKKDLESLETGLKVMIS
jgi:hypothetical protein